MYYDPTIAENRRVFNERQAFLSAAIRKVDNFADLFSEKVKACVRRAEEQPVPPAHDSISPFRLVESFSLDGMLLITLACPTELSMTLEEIRQVIADTLSRAVESGTPPFARLSGIEDLQSASSLSDYTRSFVEWAQHFNIFENWVLARCITAIKCLPELQQGARPAEWLDLALAEYMELHLRREATDSKKASHASGQQSVTIELPAWKPLEGESRASSFLQWKAILRQRWGEHERQVRAQLEKEAKQPIPPKRECVIPLELRHEMAALFQCGKKSFLDLEVMYEDKCKQSDDLEATIKQTVFRLLRVIGLKPRRVT
jgi:hypothetical protein